MNAKWLIALGAIVIVALLLAAQVIGRQQEATDTAVQPQGEPESAEQESPTLPKYNIVTLLPRDAIPAIDNPKFLSAEEADQQYDPDERVLGVEIDGDARAYSVPHLSGHEIVNDTVGGVPIAVTW